MNIVDYFEITENTNDKYHYDLCNCCTELWEEFKKNKQELWTNVTFFLDSNGKFNLKYDYTD